MKKFFGILLVSVLLIPVFADKVVHSSLNLYDGGTFIVLLENDKSETSARAAATAMYLYFCAERKLSSSVMRNQEFKILKEENSLQNSKDDISRYLISVRKFDNVRVAIASYLKNESTPYKVEYLEYNDKGYYSKNLTELYNQALDEIKTWIEDR